VKHSHGRSFKLNPLSWFHDSTTYLLDTKAKDFSNYVNNPSCSHLPRIIPLYSLSSSFIGCSSWLSLLVLSTCLSLFPQERCSPRKCSDPLLTIFWFFLSLLTIIFGSYLRCMHTCCYGAFFAAVVGKLLTNSTHLRSFVSTEPTWCL
jgi:hypothetical protein